MTGGSDWKLIQQRKARTVPSIEKILRQLEVGIPGDCLDLLTLPLPLGRGEYLALRQAGIKTSADVWLLAADNLIAILGAERAAQLNTRRPS
jgi:hypothetical protein